MLVMDVKLLYKRIGYDLNVMRHSVCLVIKPITVENFAALFNCTPIEQASDSIILLWFWLLSGNLWEKLLSLFPVLV